MKLNYSHIDIARFAGAQTEGGTSVQISSVSIDTRSIVDGSNTLFVCLKGKRDGADFIDDAYKKGCRAFVVQQNSSFKKYADAVYLKVDNPLLALQLLAQHHRESFSYPVIGITGSAGKTIVKEWLYHFLRDEYHVVRSPKSFNSQIGVALSLLEMQKHHTLAIIEAGISQVGEMDALREMIQPNYGIFTNLGVAHEEGFSSRSEKLAEKAKLFVKSEWVVSKNYCFDSTQNINWENSEIQLSKSSGSTQLSVKNYGQFEVNFTTQTKLENLCNVLMVLRELNYPVEKIQHKLNLLPEVVMRMETVAGKNNNTLINDAYNMDMDGLEHALIQQKEVAGDRKRIVVLAFNEFFKGNLTEIHIQLNRFQPHQILLCSKNKTDNFLSFDEVYEILQQAEDSVILFKGSHKSGLTSVINNLSLKHHQTYLEINKQALRHNLTFFRGLIKKETKLLVMVKASSYGSGSKEMAEFLAHEGVDYLGVAFADEGIDLRKTGISLPILVMNAHPSAFDDIIRSNLEPAIFSVDQLDEFTRTLILHEKTGYPVHIKVETGMNRLGFVENEIDELLTYIKSQPEIRVKSVYSHLAESDNVDKTFTFEQIKRFEKYVNRIQSELNYRIDSHICNTSGIVNYPEAHFNMVRLGVGLFGVGQATELQNALQLKTHISKINTLKAGETIGYNREFKLTKEEKIAVLPVGYADGIRRVFGNEKAHVLINNQSAPIVGNVCMDMCFVNVTGLDVEINQEVEIFGDTHSINLWADWADTIPYEILTSISQRVKRVWVG